MRRSWLALLLLVVALPASAAAVFLATSATPIAGIWGQTGERVSWVLPGGPAWEMGARPDQMILAFESNVATGRWVMTVQGPSASIEITQARALRALRGTVPLAVAAVLAAVAAAVLLPGSPRNAAAASVVAVAASRPALMASGDLAASTAIAVAALVTPALWLLVWSPRRRTALLALILGVAMGVLWTALRFVAMEDPAFASAFDLASLSVLVTTYVLSAAVLLIVGGSLVRSRGGYDGQRLGDAVVLGAVAATVPLGLALRVPVVVIGIGVGAVLLVYPMGRARLQRALDRLVLGDVRARSSVAAIERERQRVSREIHDEPLQELAAVIGRLSHHPDLAHETAMLQEVSGRLRGVTVQLHPPILVDLGLGPSLQYLVGELDLDASMSVRLVLDPPVASGRPPEDVELAAYRITQEAVANAVRHSSARAVLVQAAIGPTSVTVSVSDDGVGIDRVAAGLARTAGHMGLRSMAERAQVVSGDLRVEDARPGTRVTFRWPA